MRKIGAICWSITLIFLLSGVALRITDTYAKEDAPPALPSTNGPAANKCRTPPCAKITVESDSRADKPHSTAVSYENPATKISEDIRQLFYENLLWLGARGKTNCYVFHLMPVYDVTGIPQSLIASAGHCPEGLIHAPNGKSKNPFTLLRLYTSELRGPIRRDDIYLGLIDDQRKNPKYFSIDENIDFSNLPYEEIITVAEVAERGKLPQLQKLKFRGEEGNHLVFDSEKPILKGFSGAPVVTKNGALLGFIVEIVGKDGKACNVYSIKRMMEFYKTLLE